MKAQFLLWFRERSVREQRLVLVMLALLAITILWLGIYRPIQNGLSSARERHQQAVVRLGEVRLQTDALRGLQPAAQGASAGPIAALVMEAANQAGFANATVAAQGDRRATVSIPSARPAAVLAWIAALEARGVVVERLSARANSDPTVRVDATLAGGG